MFCAIHASGDTDSPSAMPCGTDHDPFDAVSVELLKLQFMNGLHAPAEAMTEPVAFHTIVGDDDAGPPAELAPIQTPKPGSLLRELSSSAVAAA